MSNRLLTNKKEAAVQRPLPWHPNFRNYEKLPDIKVVRTAFFINVAAVSLVVCAAFYAGFQEYTVQSLRAQIDDYQAVIDRDKGPSDRGIQLFRKFQEHEKKLKEIEEFSKSRPAVSPILLHLAEILPGNLALSYFDLRDKGLVLRGVVRGAPELASGEASAFVETLRKDTVLNELFEEVSVTSLNRNSGGGRLNFEIFLRFKAPAKPKVP